MKTTVIIELRLPAGPSAPDLEALAAAQVNCPARLVRVVRHSLDARSRQGVFHQYRLLVEVATADATRLLADVRALPGEAAPAAMTQRTLKSSPEVVIAGMGPCGLFCALGLLHSGARVTLLERGRSVEERAADIAKLRAEGVLDAESNVLFGEGGAGTWSDGKLTTRTHRPEIERVFQTLVDFGADSSILYEAHPHLGTDGLHRILPRLRQALLDGGCRIVFGEKLEELLCHDGAVRGVRCAGGNEYTADAVVLAIGHSARDTLRGLTAQGVHLERKDFAAGFRIEHPAAFVNRARYGRAAEWLPAADYRLTYQDKNSGRGVYSFCMCPGGEIINSSSEQGLLCVNGMSNAARNGEWSNSAIVVQVRATDCPAGPLGGVEFQRGLEAAAFKAGGGGCVAPAFAASRLAGGKGAVRPLPAGSYRPGIVAADPADIFPSWMRESLARGLDHFDRSIPGFVREGLCVAAETRTSSPVRLTRGDDLQSVSHRGLYPAGEGAGYAGGIVSSAVDGLRVATRLLEHFAGE